MVTDEPSLATRPTARRLTVSLRIVVGLIVIIGIGLLSMLQINRGLNSVRDDIRRLANVEAPLNAAAYEMEVNVNGIGLAVLKYLATGDRRYRMLVDEDEADFAIYRATYMRLIKTERERVLGERIGQFFRPYRSLAYDLMRARDQQEAVFATVSDQLEQIDAIVDDRLEAQARRAGDYRKALAITNIEAEAGEVGFRLADYRRNAGPASRKAVFAKLEEFGAALAAFRALDLTAEEKRQAARLRLLSGNIRRLADDVLAFDDSILAGRQRFLDLRVAMDEVFDLQLQPLALRGLETPRAEAEAAAARVLATMRYLIPIYLIAAGIIGFLLISVVTRPLRRLKAGAEAIGRGDLDHRIAIEGNDEFGDLSAQFNRMVEKLRATTVSKDLLEESENNLKRTVDTLRHEIAEREALQAELRRAETMSAMGTLLAGVAHEVRNPLFAVSSTLDAMNARLGDREEYRRYLRVLKKEVARLAKLMGDLLEYGKPRNEEFAAGSIKSVVETAMDCCAPLAEQLGAAMRCVSDPDLPPVVMDAGRLTQVFQNLIENGLQFSERGGEVRIEIRMVDDGGKAWIDCAVIDSGPGLPDGELQSVFEPFFTRRRGGTGLGLAIVQRIVDEHGGRVDAANRPEGGAKVTVRLPVARESGGERGDHGD